jgi:hypothetical protein
MQEAGEQLSGLLEVYHPPGVNAEEPSESAQDYATVTASVMNFLEQTSQHSILEDPGGDPDGDPDGGSSCGSMVERK